MTRRPRPFAAALAAFALVFAQVAVSAHACAEMAAPPASEVTAHHESCHEMAPAGDEPVTGNVCVEHCQYGDASVDNVQPDLVATGLVGPMLRVELPDSPMENLALSSRRPPPAAAPPPPAILFGVLRI